MKIRGQEVIEPAERIRRMTEIDPTTGCWNWLGARRRGYGRLTVGSRKAGTRRTTSAHRYAYEVLVGPIPAGLEICHRCDNRRCVNPAHLFVGTRQDNIDDREQKGRNKVMRAERNGFAKLTFAIAERIRADKRPSVELAAVYGVSRWTINRIRRGEHYPVPAAPSALPQKKEG